MPKTPKPDYLTHAQLAEGKSYKTFSPEGKSIIGTYDKVPGTALMHAVTLTEGKIEPDYADQTDMDWDSQETVTEEGQRLFVDSDGKLWPENELKFLPEDVS